MLAILVSDTSMGMALEKLSLIRERFYQRRAIYATLEERDRSGLEPGKGVD